MHPKISIIIPCYGVESYLNRCLESIVNQSLHEIEIILVDDVSPDHVPEMCDEWSNKDNRIRVIHKKRNEGLGLARNTGVEMATGEYISFVDSDDWFDLDMMERLYNECKREELDVIYSEFNVDEYPGFKVILRPEHLYVGKEEIEHLRLDIVGAEPTYPSGVKFQCSACKGLYRRNLLNRFNLRFLSEREYISEDMVFNIDVLYFADRVKTVPWQFYHYCLNGASLSHTYRADRWEKQLKMLEILNDTTKYENKEELKLRLKRTAIFYTMSACKQEKHRTDISLKGKLRNISDIINNKTIRNAVSNYPISKLPLKWFLYTLSLKMKLSLAIYIMLK